MSRAKLNGCWESGAPCPEGVCVGPHEDYALRGVKGGALGLVELPYWWDLPVDAPGSESTDGSEATVVEATALHILYDRGAHEKRLEELKRRLAAERERETELAERRRLAEKYGMFLRPKLGSAPARVEVEHVVRSSAAPSPLGGGEPGPRRDADRRIPVGVR